jgi:hypothetical protein
MTTNEQPRAHGASTRREGPRRRQFLWSAAALLVAGCSTWPPTAHAHGARVVDLQVVDRDTGAVLDTYAHRGRTYVAGRPGSRYALRISNRTGARVLAVMAVDGVNIVSGQTAGWNQGGYVLSPWQSYDIAGWRKSEHEVAAFEFTSLPDSYAARTGRPHDVGVIGVAVFHERSVRQAPAAPPVLGRADGARSEADAGNAADASSRKSGSEPRAAAAESAARDAAPQAAERLGTGHGARERSDASSTDFVRASSRPVEVLSIHYDSWDNLARAGVVAQFGLSDPRPFPKSAGQGGFVPDPPVR